MKISWVYLRSLLILSMMSLVPYIINAQDAKGKLSRQEKKELKRAVMQANFQVIDTLLEKKAFILKAEYIQFPNVNQILVNPVLNFILVDSSRAVIQTGSNYAFGYNGVGGVTAEGFLQNYSVEKNPKNFSHTLSFTIASNIGNYDVFMTIGSDGYTRASITCLYKGKVTLIGNIQNLYNTNRHKGQNTL